MSRTIKAGHVYRQYSKDGMPIADYKSSRLAHEATGVSLGSIARAAHGERKTGGGYLWRVVPEDLPWEPIQVDLSSKIGYHDKRPLIQLTGSSRISFYCSCQPCFKYQPQKYFLRDDRSSENSRRL